MDFGYGNTELLQIADAVAREKNIPKEAVLEALEDAIRVAARRKYGHEHTIRAEIDRKSGEIKLFREMLVIDPDAPIEEIEEDIIDTYEDDLRFQKKQVATIALEEARIKKADAELGEIISEPLPPIDLGRVAAQSAKQVIMHRVKEIERNKLFEEFKDKVGEIVSGVVEKIEYGNIYIKIGSAEGIIKKEYQIKTEKLRNGERVRAYVAAVNKEGRDPQIVLSRSHNEFLAALFSQEVPEIYDGIIEIRAIARDPGFRSKIAVFTNDSGIDAIGSCVGMRGARVQAVINELNGEKIDIIPWSSDPATMVVNALSPAEVGKVIIDEDRRRIEVVVPNEQLSIAIGKKGQNVRLASKLIGWEVDVLTEESESKRRSEEFTAITNRFVSALDLEEILAQLLASEGYTSVQEIADASPADIAGIEGLDENIAAELISRAKEYAETHEDAAFAPAAPAVVDQAKLDKNMLGLPGMTTEIASKLYVEDVKKLYDLADLSHDEFVDKVPESGLDKKSIDDIIMAARDIAYFKK